MDEFEVYIMSQLCNDETKIENNTNNKKIKKDEKSVRVKKKYIESNRKIENILKKCINTILCIVFNYKFNYTDKNEYSLINSLYSLFLIIGSKYAKNEKIEHYIRPYFQKNDNDNTRFHILVTQILNNIITIDKKKYQERDEYYKKLIDCLFKEGLKSYKEEIIKEKYECNCKNCACEFECFYAFINNRLNELP